MQKRRSLVAIGVALVLGLVAVYLANAFLTGGRAGTAPQGTVKVAVAAVPLEYGVQVTPEKVRLIDYPADALPTGAFRSVNELLPAGKQRIALRPIAINELILADKVTGQGQGASLAALLPPGKRAAAVRIDDVSGVAGFVRPNDSVDVLVTRSVPGANGNANQLTDLLLQNVRVIALDQDAQNEDGKPAVAKTATLEVDPLDAQKLALAQEVGQLSLVLRKPGASEDNFAVATVSLNDLRYGRYGNRSSVQSNALASAAPRSTRGTPSRPRVERRPATQTVAPGKPASNSVEVVRGTAGTNYEVGGIGG